MRKTFLMKQASQFLKITIISLITASPELSLILIIKTIQRAGPTGVWGAERSPACPSGHLACVCPLRRHPALSFLPTRELGPRSQALTINTNGLKRGPKSWPGVSPGGSRLVWQRAPHQDPKASPKDVGAAASVSPCRPAGRPVLGQSHRGPQGGIAHTAFRNLPGWEAGKMPRLSLQSRKGSGVQPWVKMQETT